MVIQRLPYILYRDYQDYGYLTDNRNFGYDTASKSCLQVGDLLLSKTGSIFYSMLSDTPQDMEYVITRICSIFKGAPASVIHDDAMSFFSDLQTRGFVFLGDVTDIPLLRSQYFSYDNKQKYELFISEEQSDQTNFDNVFGGKPRLTRVHIDVSSRCNENCAHCYIPANKKTGTMSEDMFDDILRQCREMNVLNLTISGGEPMLNPHLNSFLLKCRANNFSVNLLSNLTLLSDDLLETISSNPLISVQTSLYAMDATIHDSITNRPGSFLKTIASIEKLHKRDIPLQINCPIMKQNVSNYKDVLQFAASLNIEADADYSLYGSYDFLQCNLSCRLSADEIEQVIKEKNLIQQTSRDRKNRCSNDPICPVCKSSLCISNTGEVYPCEGWQSLILGSLSEQSLKEIWEDGSTTNRLRNFTLKDFPKCDSCQDKDYCNTCLILNVNEDANGNYKNVNEFQCRVAKLKRRLKSDSQTAGIND